MPAVSLPQKARLQTIYTVLSQNLSFNGFPVLNGKRQCIGLISRRALIVVMLGVEKDKSSLGLKKGAKTDKANYESLKSSIDIEKTEESANMQSKRSDNSS